MKIFNKVKKKLGMLALFGLLFQLTMPVYQTYVFATENEAGIEAAVETEADETEEDEVVEEPELEEPTTTEDSERKLDEEVEEEVTDTESSEDSEEEKNKEQTEELEDTKNIEDESKEKEQSDLTDETEENSENVIETESESTEDVPEDSSLVAEVKREPQKIEENIINDMKLLYKDGAEFEDGDLIDVDEDLRFELDWSIPNGHEYIAGDYLDFKLPKQITVHNSLNGKLGDYGTYTVDVNGNVKFTFNEKVEKESDIEGTFWMDTKLEKETITSTEETIDLVVNDDIVQKITVNIKPTGGQAISKKGQPVDGNFNTEEVEWTVVVNTRRDSLKNAIIDDVILAGQELILDSLILKEVAVDFSGKVTKELDEVTDFKNKSTVGNLNIELGDTNKAYKLTFRTKLLEKDFKEGTTNYKNDAVLTSDGKDDAQAGGSVSVHRPKSMEKTASTFDKEERSIEWTVNANFTEQNLKKDDVITDEFTFTVDKNEVNDVFEIKLGNIEILQVDKFDNKGKAAETSDAKSLFDITIEKNKVTYKLKEDTNKAFILKYKTELKKGAYINKDGKITNKVDLKGKTATGSQGVIQQVGKKTNDGIDYKNKTINWTITVNADKQDLRNFVLTDSFAGSGQKLVDGSIEIKPGIDASKVSVNTDNEGFKINFGDIKETYTIKYQTKFTYDFEGKKTPNFENGVKITYETSDGSEYELKFKNTVKPNKETKSNGAKNGEVNQDTKEITWKIDINYNQLSLENAKVTDAIPDNQSLIDNSVKVYETSIRPDKYGTIKEGEDVTKQFKVDASKNQVNIDFGKIDKSYRIEFKTKDKDGIYNGDEVYENTAIFMPREDETHNLTANVTLPNQGEFIGKAGTHNKQDWTIDWKIDVNKSLSTTSDFTVTDDLGDTKHQILLEDTIKVTKAGSTDELEEGKDYKLTVEGNKFEIYFPGVITEAYEINYSSYILVEENETKDGTGIENKAEIQSNDVIMIKGTTEKTETVNVKISTGGGTGEGTTGRLILEKFEADSERALEGVPFQLVRTIGNKDIVVREGLTNEEGKLEWNGLQYGDYTLKEEVPEGYLGKAKQKVTISGEDPKGIKTLPVENERKTGKAKIIKVDAHTGETIKGAKFKLTNQTTKQEYEFETDKDGVILEKVPYGEYTIEEIEAPNGYRITENIPNVTVEIDKEIEITVENVAYVDIPVQKTWYVDEGKQLPESVTVNLLRNGQVTGKSITLKAANNWKNSFKDLDKYTEANREIKYTIKEEAVDGYIVEQDGYNLTNIQSTDISVKKKWVDDNNPDRPTSVKVQLYADGKALAGKVVTLSSDADDVTKDWAHTFMDLPMYTNKGEKINYTVKEVETPKNYESSVEDYEITNLRKAITSVSGEKTWKDEDPTDRPKEIKVNLTRALKGEVDADFNETLTVKPNAKGEWKYTFDELDQFDEQGVEYIYIVEEDEVPETYKSTVDGYDITNVRVGKTKVSGTKRWKDDKVDDRPETITVNLLRNNVVIDSTDVTADDNWKYSFTELEKYDNEGKYYNYTVKEEQVPGYAPEVKGKDITNTRSEKTNFEITKGWLDDDSEDRPDSIMVYIYQNDKLFDTVTVTASEEWVYEVTDIEAYDEDGQPYTYTIKEKPLTEKDSIDQYETTVNGFNITNLRVGETEVTGEKIWKEVDSQYRPDSITVNLLANGETEDSITVSGETNWKYAFKELAKYDDQGKEINYTVTEDDVPAGYESAVEGNNIINKQISTEVTGKKVWLDDNNPERPDSIKVHLLANGEETDHSLEVSGETDWNYRFTDIPKYDKAGKEIEYSVEEEAVKGYDTRIDGFVITNLRVGEVEVSGEKVWKDAGPADRPESIDVILTRNVKGELDTDFEQELTVKPDSKGVWKYTFDELPEFDEIGQAYTYTVKEETTPAGYESSVDGYDITNLRVGTVNLSGVKTWKDDNITNRPDSIKVNLLRNNVVIDTKEVQPEDPADEWAYTFSDLAEFDEEGIAYEYRVSEEDVPGYTTEFAGMNITNTRSEKKTIEITKGWLDDNSKDRPQSIEVDVYQNDELFKTVKVKASEDWTYELKDLEAYDEEGQAYTYTIEEREIKGYETKVDGFNLTNTRTDTPLVKGEKHWKDDNSPDRPESIAVTLTRELKGKADESFTMTQTVTPDATGKWAYVFDELPAFDEQGVAYDYQVKENGVPEGYKTSVDGYDITNLRVGKINMQVEKKWMNDTETNRPEKITVDLMQNGKLFESITLSKATGWTYTFTDLDEFDQDGKAYEYTIEEKPVKGYKSSVEETKEGFVLINTYNRPETPESPEKPKPDKPEDSKGSWLPKTGESNNSVLYLVGGMLVLVGLIIGRKRLEE